MKTSIVLAILVVVLFVPAFASANTLTFDWSYAGAGVTAAGQLTAVAEGGGEYLITSLTGERNGSTITAFATITCPTNGCVSTYSDGSTYDNLFLYTGSPSGEELGQVNPSANGFIFTTAQGSFNVFFNPAGQFGAPVGDYEYEIGTGSVPGVALGVGGFDPAPVPEPSAISLLGVGLIGLGLIFRNKLAVK